MKNFSIRSGVFALFIALGVSLTSCNQNNRQQQENDREPAPTRAQQYSATVYQAQISPLNQEANGGEIVSGNVRLEVDGDELQIIIDASGLEPDMMYLQHLHGSKEGDEKACPDDTADTNNDGVVDITEAYDVAGVTMIPFHDDPTSFEIKTDTYPTADENGTLTYRQTVDLNELRNSFLNEFDWEEFDLNKFTYLIHGVEEGAVPESAQSVENLPAHVTLPVGCADIVELGADTYR